MQGFEEPMVVRERVLTGLSILHFKRNFVLSSATSPLKCFFAVLLRSRFKAQTTPAHRYQDSRQHAAQPEEARLPPTP